MKIPINRIELNTTELCNRKCSFCPRAYGYPNQNFHMTGETMEEIIIQTDEYTNYICIAGRGEPFLCKNILEIIDIIAFYNRKFYVQTNGDQLDDYIDELHKIMNLKEKIGKYKILVNCYDGEEQRKERQEKWGEYKAVKIVTDRIDDTESNHYKTRMNKGKYVNRGGYLPWNLNKNRDYPCYILFHKCYINWNGDVQLCCHDWTHMYNFGNIYEKSLKEIWEGEELMDRRLQLQHPGGRQNFIECKNCDSLQQFDQTAEYYEMWKSGNVKRTDEIPSVR